MTRLLLCILLLGGTVAFLSCSDSLDDNTGAGGKGGGGGRDGAGPVAGRGGTGACGNTDCDGEGPSGGRGGSAGTGGSFSGWDGSGPPGGTTGTDGTGPSGGRGGTTGGGGRGGTGACGNTYCDGAGPVGGRGGSQGDGTGPVGGRGGTTGALGPCDGLGYFQERLWCASTYAAQAAKQIPGNCDYVRVFTGTCDGKQVWTTRYSSLGDPLVCSYDSGGNLVGARVCTDTPMPAWNCNGAATSPNCLSAGSVPNIQACALTTTCDATGGRGGGSGGCPAAYCDGGGPIGGRGGAN